jgi:hypothetical protein
MPAKKGSNQPSPENHRERATMAKRRIIWICGLLAYCRGKRFSVHNLKLMRCFYIIYSQNEIRESMIPHFTSNVS